MLQPRTQHPLHDLPRQAHVDPAAGQVQEIAAHAAQDNVGQENDDHPRRQHPQGLHRVIGYHPVVHIHGEQGQRQGEDVDEKRRQQHIPVDRHVGADRVPEPVAAV